MLERLKVFKVFFFSISLILVFGMNSYAMFPSSYVETSDISYVDRAFNLNNNDLVISMTRPAKPFKGFMLYFKFAKNNISNIYFTTNMEMNMGNYSKMLYPTQSDNSFYTQMVLPKCGSGRSLWYGKLDITFKDNLPSETVYFFYNVK